MRLVYLSVLVFGGQHLEEAGLEAKLLRRLRGAQLLLLWAGSMGEVRSCNQCVEVAARGEGELGSASARGPALRKTAMRFQASKGCQPVTV